MSGPETPTWVYGAILNATGTSSTIGDHHTSGWVVVGRLDPWVDVETSIDIDRGHHTHLVHPVHHPVHRIRPAAHSRIHRPGGIVGLPDLGSREEGNWSVLCTVRHGARESESRKGSVVVV